MLVRRKRPRHKSPRNKKSSSIMRISSERLSLNSVISKFRYYPIRRSHLRAMRGRLRATTKKEKKSRRRHKKIIHAKGEGRQFERSFYFSNWHVYIKINWAIFDRYGVWQVMVELQNWSVVIRAKRRASLFFRLRIKVFQCRNTFTPIFEIIEVAPRADRVRTLEIY